MSFEALLYAIDQYIAVRHETEEKAANGISDWDCGLTMEFESLYVQAGQSEQLRAAGSNLEKVLNSYIDERVQAALRSRCSQGG